MKITSIIDWGFVVYYRIIDFLPKLVNFIDYDNFFFYCVIPSIIFWSIFSPDFDSYEEYLLDEYVIGLFEILGWWYFFSFGLYTVASCFSALKIIDTSETYLLMFPFFYLFSLIIIEILSNYWWMFLEFCIKKFPDDELTLFIVPYKEFFDLQDSDEGGYWEKSMHYEDCCWFRDTDYYTADMIKGTLALFFCILFYFCTVGILGTGYSSGQVPYIW
jgi:hypothetical protein